MLFWGISRTNGRTHAQDPLFQGSCRSQKEPQNQLAINAMGKDMQNLQSHLNKNCWREIRRISCKLWKISKRMCLSPTNFACHRIYCRPSSLSYFIFSFFLFYLISLRDNWGDNIHSFQYFPFPRFFIQRPQLASFPFLPSWFSTSRLFGSHEDWTDLTSTTSTSRLPKSWWP